MRLLVLGCSERKKAEPAALPALERYDGVLFRVFRKWHAQATSSDPHIVIISAKHGLLGGSDLILNYNQRVTKARVEQLRCEVNAGLREQLNRTPYQSVFLGLGKAYRSIVDTKLLDQMGLPTEWASGPIGAQAAQLKDWLWREAMNARDAQSASQPAAPAPKTSGIIRLRGLELRFTPEEVMARARQALAVDSTGANSFTNWHAVIDEQQVSTKWLVRTLSGLPLGAFSTGDARRVLAQLGIATYYAPAGRLAAQHGDDNL